ncbi:MAG: hypothetical protein Q9182_006261 [Xanthomendoza sp. 2 TL-2023]
MASTSLSPRLFVLFLSLGLFSLSVAAAGTTCYYPNGTAAIDNNWPYEPCKRNTPESMCCRKNSMDKCRSDGLCDSSWDGNTWRDFCTDPTWQSPNCIKLCLDFTGEDGDGNTGGTVRVTQCQDGSYCCGTGTTANNCCAQGNGVWIAKDGHTTNVKPTSTSSTISRSSAVASSTLSTSQTTTSTTPPPGAVAASQTATGATGSPSAAITKTTEKAKNNTGAIAGGVVGGLVAAAIIVMGGIWLMMRRRNKRMNDNGPFIPYGASSQSSKPTFFNEVEGSNARMELPALVGHEMGVDQQNEKKYPVHEMQ